MSEIKYISGKEISCYNIFQALQLDKMVYDNQYFLELSTCINYYKANPYIYFMALNSSENVIGYINFSPITYEMFKQIKSGNVIDTAIGREEIITYDRNQTVYGYFSSIVVHPSYRNRGIGTELINMVFKFLRDIALRDNVFFEEIVADAVSADGENFLKKIGFSKEINSTHNSQIMVLKPLPKSKWQDVLN